MAMHAPTIGTVLHISSVAPTGLLLSYVTSDPSRLHPYSCHGSPLTIWVSFERPPGLAVCLRYNPGERTYTFRSCRQSTVATPVAWIPPTPVAWIPPPPRETPAPDITFGGVAPCLPPPTAATTPEYTFGGVMPCGAPEPQPRPPGVFVCAFREFLVAFFSPHC